ncbi:hypothetical protein [Shewanella sp.]|jgi:hypothetical protein|uniref:hypothetical protein n=1 Tax=Shewanella sp. TaxID=50422 RepID=UPI0035619FBD
MNKWTWIDEVAQNLIGLAIIGCYLYLVIMGRDTPTAMEALVVAVVAYYGFKSIKKNGTPEAK